MIAHIVYTSSPRHALLRAGLAPALLLVVAGCTGKLSSRPADDIRLMDGGTTPTPGTDAWVPPGTDGGTPPPPGTDAGPAPVDSGPPPTVDAGPPPPPPGTGLVDGLAVTGISAWQAVRVGVVEEGTAVSRRNAPIVAGKDTLVRVYVRPGAGWAAQEVMARLDVAHGSGTESFMETRTVRGESREEDASSVFDFLVPGRFVTASAQISVALLSNPGRPEDSAGASDARYPRDGSRFGLGAEENGGLDVVVVPVQYQADGSGRLPDTSDAAMEALREQLLAVYPVAPDQLRLRVRAPMPFSSVVARNGAGFSELLEATRTQKQRDGAPGAEYYFALVAPASSFSSFCSGGCVSGLASVPPPSASSLRVGVGIWYGSESSRWTAIHELGHTQGRPHAPCGGASGVDPSYPHGGGGIGAWGRDERSGALLDPTRTADFMGYCRTQWTSDYTYGLIHERIRAVTGPRALELEEEVAHYVYLVDGEGTVRFGGEVDEPLARPGDAIDHHGGVRLVEARDALGRPLGWVAAHEAELSDHAGRYLLVPTLEGAVRFELPDGSVLEVPSDVR